MANKKTNHFTIKKSYHNVYFLLISIVLMVIAGFIVSKTVTFFVIHTDEILNDNQGALSNKKEFNMKAFEDLKTRRPLVK